MTELHVVPDADIPGVVRISRGASLPGPRVGVLGAIHGNETCGLEAIHRLRRVAETGGLPVAAGTIVLVHGNPAATEQGRRFTEGGEDINRILDYRFVERLAREAWTPEHHRALALRPVLEELDALLDLHSATEETPPFGIVNDVPASLELARRCGVRAVTRVWSDVRDCVTIGVLARRGRPGVSVECGQHEAEAAVAEAVDIALRFLRATGAASGGAPPAGDAMLLEVTDVLRKPSAGFRFASAIRGLDELPAGHLVGRDGTIEMRVTDPAIALLPNDTVAVGEDLVYLARPLVAS